MVEQVVCVVGGGTAGLEALLAAREQLGEHVGLRLIAPEREFRYRPMSRDSLFRPAPERGLAIATLTASVGASWVCDRADIVDQQASTILTRDGEVVDFDVLLLATGARSARTLRQGQLWTRGRDPSFLDEALAGIAAGAVRNVGVIIPRGARWPLPAYELALVLAWSSGSSTRVVLLTAEQQPLCALGGMASRMVCAELEDAGVDTITGVEVFDEPGPEPSTEDGARIRIVPETSAEVEQALSVASAKPSDARRATGSVERFDRLISLPTITGPSISGVPTDAAGFIAVDDRLRVWGSDQIWAAGRCIAAALEHGALAAGQADVAIAGIAEALGRTREPPAEPPDLMGILLSGQRERWLDENPPGTHEPSTRCLWWPPGRAVGAMLSQRIAAWDPDVHQSLPQLPEGLVVRVPIAVGWGDGPPPVGAGATVAKRAWLREIENRQLMALRRREREADSEQKTLGARLKTLAARERDVIRELERHGYIRSGDRPGAPR